MAPKKKSKTAAPPLACFAGAKIAVIGANPFQRKLWEAKIGAGTAFLKPSQAASLKEGNDFVVICVEIKILRRVRAESSRHPPCHRRDACSTAWRCGSYMTRFSHQDRVVAEK